MAKGIKPNNFATFADSITDSNWEFYSQKGGIPYKTDPTIVRLYMGAKVNEVPLGTIPSASSNVNNLNEFVEDSAGDLWFIDVEGDGLNISSFVGGGAIDDLTGTLTDTRVPFWNAGAGRFDDSNMRANANYVGLNVAPNSSNELRIKSSVGTPTGRAGVFAIERFNSTHAIISMGEGASGNGQIAVQTSTGGIGALLFAGGHSFVSTAAPGNFFGVGTPLPTTKLDVDGGMRIRSILSADFLKTDGTGVLSAGTFSSITATGVWTRTGTNVHLTNINDLVGAGVTAPVAKFHAQSNFTTHSGFYQSGTTGNLAAQFATNNNRGYMQLADASGTVTIDLRSYTHSVINTGFNLGINVTSGSPAEKLHVQNGNLLVKGTTSASNIIMDDSGGFGAGFKFRTTGNEWIFGGTTTTFTLKPNTVDGTFIFLKNNGQNLWELTTSTGFLAEYLKSTGVMRVVYNASFQKIADLENHATLGGIYSLFTAGVKKIQLSAGGTSYIQGSTGFGSVTSPSETIHTSGNIRIASTTSANFLKTSATGVIQAGTWSDIPAASITWALADDQLLFGQASGFYDQSPNLTYNGTELKLLSKVWINQSAAGIGAGNLEVTNRLDVNPDATSSIFGMWSPAGQWVSISMSDSVFQCTSSRDLQFGPNTQDDLLVLRRTFNRVGINKPTALGTLHVNGTGYWEGLTAGTAANVLYIDPTTKEIKEAAAPSTSIGPGTANRFAYWTSSTTIGSSDVGFFDGTNVGINQTSPVTRLHLKHVSNPFSGLGTVANYAMFLQSLTADGAGQGIAFGSADSGSNIGASILFYREGANSEGQLRFYTKNTTTGSVAPEIALTLDDQKAAIGTDTLSSDNLTVFAPTGTSYIRLDTGVGNNDVGLKLYEAGTLRWDIHNNSTLNTLDFNSGAGQVAQMRSGGEFGINRSATVNQALSIQSFGSGSLAFDINNTSSVNIFAVIDDAGAGRIAASNGSVYTLDLYANGTTDSVINIGDIKFGSGAADEGVDFDRGLLFRKRVRKNGVLSVSISTNQDDYNPAGLGNANVLRVTNAAGELRGLAAQPAGTEIIIFVQDTSNSLVIPQEALTSTAANRFYGGATIPSRRSAVARYSGEDSRWVIEAF